MNKLAVIFLVGAVALLMVATDARSSEEGGSSEECKCETGKEKACYCPSPCPTVSNCTAANQTIAKVNAKDCCDSCLVQSQAKGAQCGRPNGDYYFYKCAQGLRCRRGKCVQRM